MSIAIGGKNITDFVLDNKNIIRITDYESGEIMWEKSQLSDNYFYVEDISGATNTVSITGHYGNHPINVYKSTDKTNWTLFGTTKNGTISTTISANTKLYLKANTNQWSTSDSYSGIYHNITASGYHNVGGNVMSLIKGDNFGSATTIDYPFMFSCLFDDNTKLVNASDLILPATSLSQYCYSFFFCGCSSLISFPELQATTLEKSCYEGFFQNCSSLTTSPTLLANTLVEACYYQMFYGCSSLRSITTYAQDISASYCLGNWLGNVASTGTFHNLGGATYETDSTSGIPTGWTEVTT